MIVKKALDAFLNRDLDSFDWIKSLSKCKLRREFKALKTDFTFHTKPYKHQLACFLIGIKLPSFLFLLDMGLGKSKIAVDVIRYRMLQGEITRTLVLVPNEINVEGWQDELLIHSPKSTTSLLVGSLSERMKALTSDSDFFICSYPALQTFMTELVQIPRKKSRKRMVVDSMVKVFVERFDALIFDETQFLGNKGSLTFKLCNKLSKTCRVRYGLTGTPLGRDPIILWSQFYLIDRGLTLGKNIGMYREAFFEEKPNYFSGGVDYKFDEDKKELLHSMMLNRSIRYDESECSGIPKVIRNILRVTFPSKNYKYYKEKLLEMKKAKGNYAEIDNVFIRMRQIASGFLGVKSDNDRVDLVFPTNPKVEALESLVGSLPLNKKMVIFHEFIRSGEVISDVLKKMKVKHVHIGKKTKDKIKDIRKFKTDPSYRILVINSKTGGTGGNYQVANYLLFYESPVSPIVRKQSEKRLSGARQKLHSRVYIYDLVMKNSVEEKILEYLKEGEDLFSALVDGNAQL